MTAVVIPRDREYAYALLPVPRDCRSVLPGCRNRPTYRTTFYVMTFGDGQDTGRGSQVRGCPYRKHSTGLCGTTAGVKVVGPGRERE